MLNRLANASQEDRFLGLAGSGTGVGASTTGSSGATDSSTGCCAEVDSAGTGLLAIGSELLGVEDRLGAPNISASDFQWSDIQRFFLILRTSFCGCLGCKFSLRRAV